MIHWSALLQYQITINVTLFYPFVKTDPMFVIINNGISIWKFLKTGAVYAALLFLLLGNPFKSLSQQIYIGQGAYLVMKGQPFLQVNNASLKNDGNLIPDLGTVKFTGDADTGIAYISGTSQSIINNVLISKSAYGLALKSGLVVKDTISISQGILYSNGYLILKSDSSKTATLTALPVNGSGIATAYIAGAVSIERYIKARKAWRLLSAPVKNSGVVPTINQAWQEGVTSGNHNAGYGIHIIGGTTANGYDTGPTSNASVKIYDTTTNNFIALPAVPGTNAAINNHNGYFAFVWGNRSTNLFNSGTAATPTTLRMKGELKTGDQVIPVNAFKYTVLGNPYPSAIDFGLLTKYNVRNAFYAWDPMLAGTYGVGGYVTVSWNGSTYDVTGNVSDISQCIPSGSAVMIQSADSATAGSITIKESAKTFCNSEGPLARNELKEQISTLLYESNADGSRALMDAVLTTYADHYSNEKDEFDVTKIGAKYIGLQRGNNLFAIERRKTITASDTVFLKLNSLSIRKYQLNVVLANMETVGLQAILKDSYSAELNNKLLNMNDSNAIEFQVNSNAASYAANRFSIVFMPLSTLPVTFTSVQALQVFDGIAVKWVVENEGNIKEYVLEKSINGTAFYPIQTLPAKAINGATALYAHLDKEVAKGNNFYRVRSVSINAATANSRIVKVYVAESSNNVVVFPNPVEGNMINLQINNQPDGVYELSLLSASGQKVYTHKAQVSNSNNILIQLSKALPAGIYQLEITTPAHIKLINKIIIQ